MTAVTRGADIAASPDAVMAVLLDVERYPEWQREISRVEVHERDDQGRPALVTTSIKAVGRAGTYTVRYAYPSATVMTYRLVRADMMSRHDARFAIAANGGGSRLEVALDLQLKWPIPSLVLSTLIGKGVGAMLDSVKQRAELR